MGTERTKMRIRKVIACAQGNGKGASFSFLHAPSGAQQLGSAAQRRESRRGGGALALLIGEHRGGEARVDARLYGARDLGHAAGDDAARDDVLDPGVYGLDPLGGRGRVHACNSVRACA